MKNDVVILGGGLAGLTAAVELQKAGLSCAVVSEGLSLHETPAKEFIALGGMLLRGDSVIKGNWEGDRLKSVCTRNLEKTELNAENFILATGKFFSKGLVATMDSIYEPVFGADVRYEADRDKWCDRDFFAAQAFESFGVITDDAGHLSVGGRFVPNLYAAGEVLEGICSIGADAEDKICASARKVVSEILKKH